MSRTSPDSPSQQLSSSVAGRIEAWGLVSSDCPQHLSKILLRTLRAQTLRCSEQESSAVRLLLRGGTWKSPSLLLKAEEKPT